MKFLGVVIVLRLKKLLSVFLCVVLSACIFNCAGMTVGATIMASEIQQALQTKMTVTGYKPGYAPPSSYTKGSGCYGFVDMLCRYLYGHGLPSQASNHYQFTGYGTNFTQIGSTLTINSGTLTEASLKTLFTQAQAGDVIQMDYTKYSGSDSLHTMMVYSVSSSGVVFYHAGSSKVYFGASSGTQPLWGTTGNVLTWAKLKAVLVSSDDGISLYRSKQNGSSSGSTSSGSTTGTYTSTNPDDYTYPTQTLKYTSPTMKGTDVAWVQAVLYQLGYSIDIDGSYGKNSVAVIQQFQSDYGLTVDGYCGPITRAKLLALWEEKKHTHSWQYSYYEASHPHCNVYICSCGESYTDSESSNYYSKCAECNPIGASTVTLSSNKIAVGAPVTVSWTKSANTNSYTLKYYNDNNEYTTVCNTTSNSYEIVFETAGNYYIYVDSIGTNGYKQSNIVKITASDAVVTITFNANGGENAPDPIMKNYGENISLWTVVPTRKDYKFIGWDTDPNASYGSYWYGATYSGNESVTLYAIWKFEDFKSYFDCDDNLSYYKYKLDGVNVGRSAASVILYNESFGSSTMTNEYGCEASVDSTGKVISNVYGVGSAAIPSGGFVISAHSSYDNVFVTDYIKEGNYIYFDASTEYIYVFPSYEKMNAFLICRNGHKGDRVIKNKVEATYDSYGNTGDTCCSVCNDIILFGVITEPLKYTCDFNSDDYVNATDILFVRKELINISENFDSSYDINYDGEFDIRDLVYLKREIALAQ